MRVLLLTVEDRRPSIDAVFAEMARHVEIELVSLRKEKKIDFRKVLKQNDPVNYDRVLLDLPFRRSRMYYRYLRKFQNIFIYEEDSCQDIIPESRWHGEFAKAWKKIPQVTFINTGYQVSHHFAAMDIHVRPLYKGFDASVLYNEKKQRQIELGFVGRINSKAYSQRRELLESLVQSEGLQLMKTEPGEDYRTGLNSISIFLSADIGLHEYMAKNFEAMACGCCVLAYRQGKGEEEWLGLEDMRNIVLYGSVDEAREKIAFLRNNPEAVSTIAAEGEKLAKDKFTYEALGKGLVTLLQND